MDDVFMTWDLSTGTTSLPYIWLMGQHYFSFYLAPHIQISLLSCNTLLTNIPYKFKHLLLNIM